MRFVSVNRQSPPATFEEILLRSIAPDGGVYVPEFLPLLSPAFVNQLADQSLNSIGCECLARFFDEINSDDLRGIIARAWNFPLPLTQMEDDFFLLELFHGPTLAFKDVGARFMAEVVSHLLGQKNERVTILVATSGDTGSAVAHGFYNTPHVDVVILYPSGKISRLQEQQMTTLGGNIHALEVEGTFDDCQKLVKQALVDQEIQRTRVLTSANSINLARLLPQIVYYAWGISQWQKKFRQTDEQPTIVVPSGNFGNLTAAMYAKWMGIPIKSFIAATNRNDVVPHYLLSGKFHPQPSIQTFSNAMDVGNPNNFPRIQSLYRNDLAALRRDLSAISIDDTGTLDEIRQTYERMGIILDPHTAVGVAAARRLSHNQPVIIAATAHPAKFPEVIKKALAMDIPPPPALRSALEKPKQSIRIPNNYQALKKYLLA